MLCIRVKMLNFPFSEFHSTPLTGCDNRIRKNVLSIEAGISLCVFINKHWLSKRKSLVACKNIYFFWCETLTLIITVFAYTITPRGFHSSKSRHTAHYFAWEVMSALKASNQHSHGCLCGSRPFHGEISQKARERHCPLSLHSVVTDDPYMERRSWFGLKDCRFAEIFAFIVA